MKQLVTLVFFTMIFLNSVGQDTIDVVEKSIKIGGLARETEYYGFAEGDKVIFNLTVDNRKDLKDVTISEYPNSVKFADHTTNLVQNKAINISRKGVYVFEYYNSNLSGRTVNIKIQRVPKSEDTKYFNTNVKWVNQVDTTFSAQEKTYVVCSDTTLVDVINSKVRVHSQTNLDNPNKTLVDFVLPANTIKWTYWIGVGNEGQEAYQKDQANFSKIGAKVLGSFNPLAGFAFGLISMTHVSIGDNVKYYFMRSSVEAQKFSLGQEFLQFKNGNIVTDFGLMNYSTKTNEKYFIGLVNDNMMQGIDVTVKILAVVVTNKYKTVVENVPSYTNKLTPVNEK